jgi:tetratricopeptide (TPR) repeat protein
MRALGKLDEAGANAAEAVQLLGGLRAAGDKTEATAIALALAYSAQSRVLESRNDPADLPTSQRGLALLEPFLNGPTASVAAQRAYVVIATRIGFAQQQANHYEESVGTEREVMRVAAALGARDLRDLDMGAYYAEACGWLVQALESLGRYTEARRDSEECLTVSEGVLARRPGYRLALHAEQVITGILGAVAQDELDPREAQRAGLRQEQVSETLFKLDPANIVSINNFAVAEGQLWYAYWSAGRLHEAMPYQLKQLELARRAAAGGARFYVNLGGVTGATVYSQSTLGDEAGARATLAAIQPFLEKLRREPQASTTASLLYAGNKMQQSYAALQRDDLPGAKRLAGEAVQDLEALAPEGDVQTNTKAGILHFAYDVQGEAQYLTGDFAAAERSEARAAELRKTLGVDATDDHRRLNTLATWLAMAQARQGHTEQAASTIAPVAKFDRELAARNRGDAWVSFELAAALYAQALAEPGQRHALLQEAAALIDGLAPQLKALHDVLQWRERVQKGQRGG